MGVEITWRPHELASCLHAAEAMSRQQAIVDERLAEAIQMPAAQLAAEIRAANLPPAALWRHLIPLAAKTAGHRQLIETAVTKTIGRCDKAAASATIRKALIQDLETAGRTALPNLKEELALRERPLREQWE